MSDTRIFVLDVRSEGLVAELRLNGATIFEEHAGGARSLQTKLDPYVVEGDNALDVFLGPPPPPPEGAPPLPPAAKALTLRVFTTLWGVASPDDTLAELAFDEAAHPLPEQGRARVARLAFTPPAAHGRWAWQDASPFGPADEGDALALLLDLHRALAARDGAALDALTELKTGELARALDVPADELRDDQREHYEKLFAAPDYRVGPVDPTAARFAPSDDGRLVRVLAPDGGPPLRGVANGRRFALGVTVSRVGGAMRVVR
jgi:hypothetical protein